MLFVILVSNCTSAVVTVFMLTVKQCSIRKLKQTRDWGNAWMSSSSAARLSENLGTL